MTGELDQPGGAVPQGPGSGAQAEDDPTLETAQTADDDDPTLDNTSDGAVGESTFETTLETSVPRPTGWGSRLEKMTAAKQENRRRMLRRLLFIGAPIAALIVLTAVLLAVYVGRGEEGASLATTTSAIAPLVEGSGLFLVETDGKLSWAVWVQPLQTGGVVMAIPGITLLESEGAFRTLADIYEGGRAEEADAALARALEAAAVPVVELRWSDLQAAVTAAGVQGFPAEAPAAGDEAGKSLAAALQTLIAAYPADGSASPWDDLAMDGDDSELKRAVGVDAVSMASSAWTAATLAGTLVQGEGFVYLEPDLTAARALLTVVVQVTVTTVEIRDGAGIEGATRRAGGLLEAGGFVLSPMGYAEGYPGVERTQVLSSPEATQKAQRVQSLLGMGDMVLDTTLTADHIVVILGKDFGG